LSSANSWGSRFDRVALPLIEIGAVAAIVAAAATGNLPKPFPFLEFFGLLVAGAALRRFGLPLPGKGFASFIMLLPLFAMLERGWGWAALLAVLGVLVGDVALRRLPMRAAAATAGLCGFTAALVGFVYDRIGGLHGILALQGDNAWPLVFAVVVMPLLPNAFFYLQIYLSDAASFADPRLTLRWEAIVAVFDIALAVGWVAADATATSTSPQPSGAPSGIAPSDAAPIGAALIGAATQPSSAYVVQPGDSLWRITEALLGANASAAQIAASWPALYEANRDSIGDNPSLIQPGLALTVPAGLGA